MRHYFSFDIEAAGLLGPPFAVGWVVVDETGTELEEGYLACPLALTAPPSDVRWVQEHVLPTLPIFQNEKLPSHANCAGVTTMTNRFWDAWLEAKEKYEDLVMVADCPFPVEAKFLFGVVVLRQLTMHDLPYPILDVASVLAAADQDPLGENKRKENELPAHNPVNDARQSARLLVETLDVLRYRGAIHIPSCSSDEVPQTGMITYHDTGEFGVDTLSAETVTDTLAELRIGERLLK